MPLVSILLTSYNHAKYIEESIQSVLSQTFTDFELLIVDDCSTDNSFDKIKTFKDKRITAVRNKKNMGPEYAFALLHQTAKGKYIAVADSDNCWTADKLEKQVRFLEENAQYAAVFSRVSFIDGEGNPNPVFTDGLDVFEAENRNRYEWLNYFFFVGNCLCHPTILIRREAYSECGMILNGLWQIPDFYKWIRLCLKEEIYILEDRLLKFRVHGNNISGSRNLPGILRGNNEVYQLYSLFYEISEEDFKKAFEKQANEFTVSGKINVRFALSKMLLDHPAPAAKTLALNTLFSMLNNPKEKAEILKLYNYDDVSYKQDETAYSPYVIKSWGNSLKTHTAKLYFDFGKGYNDEDVMTTDFITDEKNRFSVDFTHISDFCEGKMLHGLRFDPDDFCVKVKISKASIDGKTTSCVANKSNFLPLQYMKNKDFDFFYLPDPSYILGFSGGKVDKVSIEGSLFVLPESLVGEKFKDSTVELYKTTEKLKKAKNILSETKKELMLTQKELRKTQSELIKVTNDLHLVVNSFSWKITRPVRGVKKVVKKLLRK